MTSTVLIRSGRVDAHAARTRHPPLRLRDPQVAGPAGLVEQSRVPSTAQAVHSEKVHIYIRFKVKREIIRVTGMNSNKQHLETIVYQSNTNQSTGN